MQEMTLKAKMHAATSGFCSISLIRVLYINGEVVDFSCADKNEACEIIRRIHKVLWKMLENKPLYGRGCTTPVIEPPLEEREKICVLDYIEELRAQKMKEEEEARRIEELHKNAVVARLKEDADKKEVSIQDILEDWATEIHHPGDIYSEKGFTYVRNVVGGSDFIVYIIENTRVIECMGSWRKIHILKEGVYAYNGIKEITIKPMMKYSDGYEVKKEAPENFYKIKKVSGQKVTILCQGEETIHDLNFESL